MPQSVDPLPTPEPERGRCAFCDYRGKLTKEHVWPHRLGKEFNIIGRARHELGDTRVGHDPETWMAEAWTATVRIDCHPCNHDRLRQVESEAMDLIVQMARGQWEGLLTLSDRRKIAAFAVRMLAVTQYTHKASRPVPRQHREHLVTHLSAPPNAEVWLWMCGFHDGDWLIPEIRCTSAQLAGKGERFSGRVNAYHGILRLGHLVIEVASRTDGLAFPIVPQAPGAVLRAWPILNLRSVLVWPPAKTITAVEYRERLDSLTKPITL
jgi:hypothetical protein